MKKFSGIFLAVLLIFTAVSCSFFMEEKNNNSGSLVSFSLAGKASKAEDDNGIEEYITYGESTVKYGTWSDLKWNIWYYVTDTDAVLFTTPSEIHNLISNPDSGWKNYNNKPFIVEKGSHVWAYCENTSNTDVSPVVSYMFKGIADKEVEKTKTIIVIEPKIDEAVAFENNTRGSLKIKKLVYKMSKDQFESLASPTDLKKIKVTIKVGDKTYSTETDITNTDYEYGYAEFDPIEITGIEVSKGGTSPSDIVVEFVGLTENGTVSKECTPSNLFDMSSPTDSAVEVYILNNLETELESLVVENKTIGVATVYINTTTTDMFPHRYDGIGNSILKFTATVPDSSVALKQAGNPRSITMEYYTGEGWKNYKIGSTVTLANVGDSVYFRAGKDGNETFSEGTSYTAGVAGSWVDNYYYFSLQGKIAASGSVMSLVDPKAERKDIPCDYCFCNLFGNVTDNDSTALIKAPDIPATSLTNHCYDSMFGSCYGLTEAPELPATTLAEYCYAGMFGKCLNLTEAPELPATTLADGCYNGMFYYCEKLTKAPELPVTTLARECYKEMFENCHNLTEVPELPATTMAANCYNSMFSNCTSLVTAPELPATTLADGCYNSMFMNCTKLTTAPELPVTELPGNCYAAMFRGCTSLTKAPELPAETLNSGCYNYIFYGCSNLEYVKVAFSTFAYGGAPNTEYWLTGAGSALNKEDRKLYCPAALQGSYDSLKTNQKTWYGLLEDWTIKPY